MKFRSWLIASVLVLVLSLGSAALAQDFPVFCGDLSEADCELVQNASMNAPASTNFDLALDFSITAEGETIAFDVTGTGGYVANMEGLMGLVTPMDMRDPTAFIDFMESLTPELIESLVNGLLDNVNADLMLNINIPADVSGGMVPENLAINLWLIDGIGYVDLAPFSFADPSFDGVYGVDLNEIVPIALTQITQEDLDMIVAQMTAQNPMMSDDAMSRFADPEFVGQFATLTRVEDSTVDGVPVAVFETTIDYAALLSSPEMSEMMMQAFASDPTMEAEEAAAAMEALPQMFANSTLTSTYMIGMDDGYMYGVTVTGDFLLDVMAMAEAMGEEEEMIEPISMSMNMSFMRSNINSVDGIPAPEGATVVPLSELMGSPEGS